LLWSFAPVKDSQKYLISRYLGLRPNVASKLIYLYDRPYSAEFYSSGNAIKVTDWAQINAFSRDTVQDFFAVRQKYLPGFLGKFGKQCIRYETFDGFILLGEPKEEITPVRALTLPYD
jgi:hypothetical protein